MIVLRHVAITLLLVLSGNSFATADDDDTNSSETIVLIGGHRLLELDAQTRKNAGIETVPAQARRYRPEMEAYGKVLDITPLLNLRLQLMTAKVRHDSAAEKNRLSRAGMTRLQDLHRNDAVSTRQLQEQLAQWQTDRALADETALQRRMTIVSSLQQWGNKLTDWFTQASSPEADDIIRHKKQLLQITLPTGVVLPDDVASIRIFVSGDPHNAIAAQLVDAAPQVDPLTQGRQYFFLADNTDLPSGLHVTALIPSQNDSLDGVVIPRAALLWHMGQAFVFIEIDDGRFVRRDIESYRELEGDYFVSSAIKNGERVVSKGAQTLLSQQLRAQIPDEDDDD
ncbi:efflux RND transporter periplasmic adaptor subunit [Methylomarinum vadi]|uniref:efflux RND transporter periplasmic adaptor subunit n=1 Tax=Methylomarinum vadi TaxID=438855 RepID=UPI00068CDA6B|nr:efflux RND transporter periplasmic adaptor subunit [Methylomarinum vadi]